MKFGEKLALAMEPKWAEHYIGYGRLKTQLGRVETALSKALSAGRMPTNASATADGEPAPADESGVTPPELLRAFAEQDDLFFEHVAHDIALVEAFYLERLAAFRDALSIIGRQVAPLCAASQAAPREGGAAGGAAAKAAKKAAKRAAAAADDVLTETAIAGLKEACVTTYRSIQKLRNFGIVNFSGFIKIFKKYRKCAYKPRAEAIEEARREEREAMRAEASLARRASGSRDAAAAGAASGGLARLRARSASLSASLMSSDLLTQARAARAAGVRGSATSFGPLSAEGGASSATTPLLLLQPISEPEPTPDEHARAAAGARRSRFLSADFSPEALAALSSSSSLAPLIAHAPATPASQSADGLQPASAHAAPSSIRASADGGPALAGSSELERSASGELPSMPAPAPAPPSARPEPASRQASFGPGSSSAELISLLQSKRSAALLRRDSTGSGLLRRDSTGALLHRDSTGGGLLHRDSTGGGLLHRDSTASELDGAAPPPAELPDPTAPYADALRTCAFSDFEQVDALIVELEVLFASAFCDGDVHVARTVLLVRHSREFANWRHFQRGLKLGVVLSLAAWLLWDVLVDSTAPGARLDLWLRLVFPVYRGAGLFALALWVYAGCLLVWTRARINYVYLFDEPALEDAPGPVFDAAVNFSILYFLSLLLSLKSARGLLRGSSLNGGVYPMLTLASIPVTMLLPPRRGRALCAVLWRVLLAPFVECSFLVAFAADILTSLVKVMVDVAYGFCYALSAEALRPLEAQGACADSRLLSSGLTPLILAGPTFLRLCQNLRKYYDEPRQRHPSLSNALKYLCSLSVSLLGVFHKEFGSVHFSSAGIPRFQLAWLSLYVLSALYSFAWDVFVDWGLGARARTLPASAGGLLPTDGAAAGAAAAPSATGEALERARAQRGGSAASAAASSSAASSAASAASQELGIARAHAEPAIAERRIACGLREHLLYRSAAFYYFVIAADLFGRFGFLYTLVPKDARLGGNIVLAQTFFVAIGPFVAAVEVVRRGMWSLLRLENQQLGNGPDRPRTTDSIPLHFDKEKKQGQRADENSVMLALLEVGAFVLVTGGVLVFSVATRTG